MNDELFQQPVLATAAAMKEPFGSADLNTRNSDNPPATQPADIWTFVDIGNDILPPLEHMAGL
jgi:hypothetical protein